MKKTLLLFFIFICHLAFSQSQNIAGPYLQSPNAASLGIYNKVDISPFTGLANVTIPVFSVAHGDISVKADLRYFTGGVKPEDHPGWVGQNWSLNVGGIVTRKRNGGVDEVSTNSFPNNFSYYVNFGTLNNEGWNSQAFMKNYLDSDASATNPAKVSPDEFMFILPNGKSGSFMKNHLGNWVVKSSNTGKMKVEVSLSPTNPNLLKLYSTVSISEFQYINRIIYKIVITDDEGYIFTFGGVLNAVEFIRERNIDLNEAKNNVIANAWHLTEIRSTKNNVVTFKYDRGSHQFIQNVGYGHTLSYNINNGTCSGSAISSLQYNGYIITPSFLKEISSNTFKILFQKEESIELKYPYGESVSSSSGHSFNNFWYGDFSNGAYGDVKSNGAHLIASNPHKDYKLSEIVISNQNGNPKERYLFNYNNDRTIDHTKRLFLKSFSKVSPTLLTDEFDVPPITYDFLYDDAESLPPYNSLKIDEWGYFNNKPYPITNTSVNVNTLMAKYVADFEFAKKGSLTQIRYPTGGYTNFEYELNNYSKFIKKTPNAINIISSLGQGGGLRIKKIHNYSSTGVYTSKEYVYKSSGVSSGILAGKKNIYFKAQIGQSPSTIGFAEYVSNNSISDLNYTNGRDVVYSTVEEILEDSSRNVYKYTNSENPEYRDESPNNIYVQGISVNHSVEYGTFSATFNPSYTFPLVSHTSREQERGQLLSKETFSSNGTLVYKEINEYRNDLSRFDEYVRSYNYASQSISCGLGFVMERYVEPIKIYTYLPYLKKRIESTFDANGDLISSKTSNYSYDHEYRQLKDQTFTNSKGGTVKTEYTYPFDLLPNNLFQGMINKNLNSTVIQEKQTVNSLTTGIKKFTYIQKNSMYLIESSEYQIGNGSAQITSFDYDSEGNLRSFWDEGGPKTSYLWGYKQQYPTAEVKNAIYSQIYHESFEDALNFSGVALHDSSRFYSGKKSVKISNTTTSKKVASSTVTVPVNLTGKMKFTYSGWVYSDAPSAKLILIMLRAGETSEYSYIDQIVTSQTGKWVYLQKEFELPADVAQVRLRLENSQVGNVWFDDLRVHPSESLMSTYTFDHLVGMTSHTDSKGATLFYEFDAFGRLKYVKNQSSEIRQANTYNFREVYYNSRQEQVFDKQCSSGIGSKIIYSVEAGTYKSYENTQEANSLALDDIARNGQNFANTHGTCSPLYVKKRISATGQTVIAGNIHTYAEYTADFYSDAACTQSVVLPTPVIIKYTEIGLTTYTNGNLPVPFNHTYHTTAPAGVSSVRLMAAWSYCIGGGPPILEVAGELNDLEKTSEEKVGTAAIVPDFEAHGVPPDPGDPDNPNYCYSSTVNIASDSGYIIK